MKSNFSVDIEKSRHLPILTKDYLQGDKLNSFYNRSFKLENFKDQIIEKSNFKVEKRKILVQVLKDQNKDYKNTKSYNNIDLLLKKNSFTVTTGHQLSLFSGPLFFIYKILQVIKICNELKVNYSDFNFVPIFWMASEDHDFEEIKNFNLYNKEFIYNYNYKNHITGKIETMNMDFLYEQIKSFFKDKPHIKSLLNIFKDSYVKKKNFSEATRSLVFNLFKGYDILVLDPDDYRLKGVFKNIILDEINNFSSHSIVKNSIKKLKKTYAENIKVQANPRLLNLFYLDESKRYRIEYENDKFSLVGDSRSFKKDEFIDLVKSNPNCISPNVILRPLYQESILPNISYLGGGSEISYWLELKDLFNFYDIPFPILAVRQSLALISKRDIDKIGSLNLKIEDLFLNKDQLFTKFLKLNNKYNTGIKKFLNNYSNNIDLIKNDLSQIDSTLVSTLNAMETRHKNDYNSFEKKIIKILKQKNSQKLESIKNIFERIYPNDIFQERFLNFSHFYSIHGKDFIDSIYNFIEPFDSRMQVCEI